jgi:hypothetical protein
MAEHPKPTPQPVEPVAVAINYATPQPVKRIDVKGAVAVGMVVGTFATLILLILLILTSGLHDEAFPYLVALLGAGCLIAGAHEMWQRRKERVFPWQAKLAVLVGWLALLGVLSAISGDARHRGHIRTRCQSNLRQIGHGILIYANEHGGRFPVQFDKLISHAEVSAEVFVCPGSTDNRATGITTAEILADFRKPGRCSYIYVGASLTNSTATAKHVLAYEPIDHHQGDGVHFLMGDFTVQWLDEKRAQKWIKQLEAGVNPPVP